MSTTKRRIEYELGISVDNAGIDLLKHQLVELRIGIQKMKDTDQLTNGLLEAYHAAEQLSDVLDRSYNAKLGQLDLSKVRNEITSTFGSVKKLQSQLERGGVGGALAFNSLAKSILNTNVYIKQSNALMNEMATSFKNTVKWGISSSLFNNLTGSLQKAWDYSVKLDSSLNDIRIVAEKSADEMERFAKVANTSAKNLGTSTRDYTQAALIYYQQGDNDATAQAKADVTLKTANVTGQSGQEVSEQLTAVWNGYKVSAEEAELYIDKLAAVAASTASDLEELSTGMSKVASAANIMGVDIDQLNATIATVVSVTRQAPESVGTAFKTIYSRMGDIEAGLDAETTLGSYTEKIKEIAGVNVLDTNGQLRDMGDIIEEIGKMWGSLSREQQVALSQTMAGTRQYNNLLALFDNWEMYNKALSTSKESAGALQKQQDTYMESTEAHLQKLATEAEKTYDILFDTDSVNSMTDALTELMSILNGYLTSLGGGLKTITGLGLTFGNIFGNQIGEGMAKTTKSIQEQAQNKDADKLKADIVQAYKDKNQKVSDETLQYEIESTQKLFEIQKMMSEQEQKDYLDRQRDIAQLEERITAIAEYKKIAEDLKNQGIMSFTGDVGETDFETATDNISNKIEELKSERQYFSREYNNVTKKDFEDRQKAFEAYWKESHGGSTRGMKNTKIWKENAKIIESIEESGEIENEQLSLFSEKRQELLFQYKEELELKKESIDVTEKDFEIYASVLNALAKGVISETDRANILEYQQKKINEQQIALNQVAKGAQGLADAEKNALPALIQNTEQMKRYQQATYEAKLEQEKLTKTTKGLTALGSIFMTITGSISAMSDETTSTEDKIKTMLTGMLSIGAIVLTNWKSISDMTPGLIIMLNSATVALGGSIVGVNTLTGAIGNLWKMLVPFLPKILGAVAIIGALTVAVIAGVKAWNKDADAMKAANERLADATEAYKKCKQAAEDFKQTVEEYNTAKDAVKELTSEMEGFKEAVEEANEKARELIETNKLYNDWSYDEKGVIQIDPNKLKEIQEKKDQVSRKTYSNQLGAQIVANETSLNNEAANVGKKSFGIYNYGEVVKDAAGIINTLVDEEGNLINVNSSLEEQFKKQILTNDDLSLAIKNNVNEFVKNIDALEKFAESMRKADEANQYYTDQILSNAVQDKFSGYFDAFEEIDENGNVRDDKTAKRLESTLGAIAARNGGKEFKEKLENIDVSNVKSTRDLQKYDVYKDIKGDEDLARAYAKEILGKTKEEINNLNYEKGNGKGTLKTDDGTVVLDNKNDEQMRQALAAKAEREKIEKQYTAKNGANNKKIAESLAFVAAGTDLAGQRYGADFTSAILTEIQNGPDNKIDLSSTFSSLSQGEKDQLFNMSNEDLLKMFNLNGDDLKNLGFGEKGKEAAENFGNAFKEGLKDYKFNIDDQVANGISQLDDIEDLDSEDLKIYTKHLMEASDESDKLADSLADDAETAAEVAKATMKMNKGIEDLSDNSEEWISVLRESGKESQEYAEALDGVRGSLSDILGVEEDSIDSDFITKNLEDIEKAATGDEAAIERLQVALSKDLVCEVMAVDNFDELDPEIQTLADKVASLSDDANIEIGAQLDTGDFLANANKLVKESGMTVEQAQQYFNSLGYEPEFEVETKTVKRSIPQTRTHTDYKITKGYVDIAGAKVPIPTIDRTETSWIDGYKEVDETIQVPKIGNGIKSLTKISSPSMNNYSSSNKGGKSLGKGKSGGGGGGGKPSIKDPNKEKKDPYQKVNAKLKTISNTLEKVSKEQEKLVGTDLIDNLAKQYGLLNKEIETTAEKLEIANSEQKRLQSELSAFGITFDKDSNIANYADVYIQQQNELNAVYGRYNSMSKDAQENYEATLKAAEEKWENFKKAITDYDTLVGDTIPGIESAITDAAYKQIELKLQAFHHEIEIRLEMAEAERNWNEFFNKVIKDIDEEDILGNAEAKLEDFMSYYKDNMDGIIQVNTQHIQDILTDLKTMDEGGIAKFYGEDGTNDRARALEDLQKYYEQLMKDLEAIHDLSDEIHESYVDMINEAQEKFDEQISSFETINNLLEHDKNVISMIYGEESYSTLSQFYDRQEENYNKQLDFQKQQVEFWKMQMETAEKGSDAWNAAKENWLSAVDAWNSYIETAIQNLQDKYLNAINAIFQNLNNQVTNGMGLDFVETEWDLINQNADQYLDTVNAIYKVQELQNKYLDAIDKTDSPAQQKKLNDLMQQETNYLREQDKLSEYDLERANLKYELALKQIALEEAQQNKTQLRLRRDSQGNYTYQYTQNDDQVASIQKEIADLYNQLYNLDAEQYRGNLDEIYSVWSEFQERMAEAAQINDPEQRAAKELLIKQQYSDLINGLVEKNENLQANLYQSTMSHLFDLYDQNTANYEDMSVEQKEILDQFINAETNLTGAAFDNMFDLYNINIEQFKNMTDEQKDILMSSMIPQWDSGIQQMTDKIAGEGGFLPTCKDAFEEIDKATEDYMTGIEELQKQANVNFEDIKNGIDGSITATEELLADNNELISSYEAEIEAIKGVLDQLDDLITKYKEASDAAKKATEDAKNYWLAEQNKNADVENNIENIAQEQETNQPEPVVETPKPAPAEPPKPSLSLGSYVSVKPGTKWYADSWGGGSWGYARAGSIAYTSSGPYGYNIGGLGWVRKSDIVGYDTGGYTGSWNNNNGRLAMLHQKELVLNANDTSNMLNAITILRDITANLGATLLNKMASISAGGASSIGQGLAAAGMEQNVVINAEFPNATNSREIEDALNNLVNRASQYITK